MSEIDIFIFSTSFITLDHKKLLKNSTFVGNTGHFDNEVDFAGSEGLDIKPLKFAPAFRSSLPRFADEAFEGFFFALFPDFKKVRTPAGSAEITLQVQISTLSSHQMAPAGVVAHSSSWTRVAYELEECASPEEASHEVLFQNFLMVGGSKETRLCTF